MECVRWNIISENSLCKVKRRGTTTTRKSFLCLASIVLRLCFLVKSLSQLKLYGYSQLSRWRRRCSITGTTVQKPGKNASLNRLVWCKNVCFFSECIRPHRSANGHQTPCELALLCDQWPFLLSFKVLFSSLCLFFSNKSIKVPFLHVPS